MNMRRVPSRSALCGATACGVGVVSAIWWCCNPIAVVVRQPQGHIKGTSPCDSWHILVEGACGPGVRERIVADVRASLSQALRIDWVRTDDRTVIDVGGVLLNVGKSELIVAKTTYVSRYVRNGLWLVDDGSASTVVVSRELVDRYAAAAERWTTASGREAMLALEKFVERFNDAMLLVDRDLVAIYPEGRHLDEALLDSAATTVMSWIAERKIAMPSILDCSEVAGSLFCECRFVGERTGRGGFGIVFRGGVWRIVVPNV